MAEPLALGMIPAISRTIHVRVESGRKVILCFQLSIRTTAHAPLVTFPTCWDGVNLDSPDHQSHVAYAAIPYEPYADPIITRPYTPAQERGKCPDTHPVHLPQLMYEVIFDTTEFNDKSLWPEDGSQPLVFSMGDA